MIYSKSKEETSKSSEQHDLGSLLLKLSKSFFYYGKLWNANGMKAMNHILILSKSEKGTLKSNARNTIQGDFCLHCEQIKYNTNRIKTKS